MIVFKRLVKTLLALVIIVIPSGCNAYDNSGQAGTERSVQIIPARPPTTSAPTPTTTKSPAAKARPSSKPIPKVRASKPTPKPSATRTEVKASPPAPHPAPKPTPARRTAPKKAATHQAAPAIPAAPKRVAPVPRPNIGTGTLAWSSNGSLYRWNGASWASKGLRRVAGSNGPPDYSYVNSAGHTLFTAVYHSASGEIWWSDTKLVYQQYTNARPNQYADVRFGVQKANLNGNDLLAIDDFFRDSAGITVFKANHPGADMRRSTRDAQWQLFKNSWFGYITAPNCTQRQRCP